MIGTLQLAIPLQHPVFFLGLDTNTILLIGETRRDYRSFDNRRFFLENFFISCDNCSHSLFRLDRKHEFVSFSSGALLILHVEQWKPFLGWCMNASALLTCILCVPTTTLVSWCLSKIVMDLILSDSSSPSPSTESSLELADSSAWASNIATTGSWSASDFPSPLLPEAALSSASIAALF